MDNLEKAIAKAQAEKTGNFKAISSPSSEDAPHRALRSLTEERQSSDALDFTYTHTRLVELDPVVLERNRVIAGQEDDRRVEAYRHLRTRVMQLFADNGWRTLAITSPHEDAGKSLTAVNLAISLALEVSQTVLLADLDLKSPDIASTLGVQVSYGVCDVIEGDAPISDTLFNPRIPRLTVLPGRPVSHSSSELLTSPRMRALVDEVTSRYESRIVIFDLPPLLRNDDALKFAPIADATLLVVEEGVSTPSDVERSIHLLKNSNLVGTILNKAR